MPCRDGFQRQKNRGRSDLTLNASALRDYLLNISGYRQPPGQLYAAKRCLAPDRR